jgi:hypothetical protein
MSNTRVNRIVRRYYDLAPSDLPDGIRRQVVQIAKSTKGIPYGLPAFGVFSYEEIMRGEAIIDDLKPKPLAPR